ncbi:hypothetical protein [Hymenobacter pini]|uniref:hypothetical protein n=1 Tax=Hymenobacter pini TaxID=2880879 RepID=UPI001CF53E44|nr:hypothetical protein [Hymenobacter pini]MCA8830306.1 hypothetical protein [Hymenobacter pini]
MLSIPLAGGGTLQVSNPDLEQAVLVAHAQQLARTEGFEKAMSVVYRVGGEPDPSRPWNGLLTDRLDISEKTARTLITEGKIGYSLVGEKKGYRVTERQVRAFLGELPEAA